MVALVSYAMDDGTTVVFETAEADMVSLHSGIHLTEKDGGRLSDRLASVAKAAQQITVAMKNALEPDELSVELGIKIAGELNVWFFAKNQAEATIKVTGTWRKRNIGSTPESHDEPDSLNALQDNIQPVT